LRAVHLGLAAAIARLCTLQNIVPTPGHADADDLTAALNDLKIGDSTLRKGGSAPMLSSECPVNIIRSQNSVDILNNAAVKFVHGDVDRDVYLETLVQWAKTSKEKIAESGSEIPEGLPQGDLYRKHCSQ
jgi:histone deacetylase HOS3